MREIKFRAWDKKNKEMCKPLTIAWECDCIKCVHHAKHHEGGVYLFNGKKGTDFILMQYTGLKDKNGKKIYEGDIVKWRASLQPKEIEDGIAQVVWGESHGVIGWIVKGGETSGGNYFYNYDCQGFNWEEVEIIGNIYENKNLINKHELRKKN